MVASTYPRFDQDGAGRFNRSFAEALAEAGHEVHVLVPYEPSIRPYETPVYIHPFRYVWPDACSTMGYAKAMSGDRRLRWQAYFLLPLFLFFGAAALCRLIRYYSFDLVHVHWVIPNGPFGLAAELFGRLPFFVTVHGSDVFFARRNRWFAAVARFVLRRARGITACSPELYQGALDLGAPPQLTRLIVYGADPLTCAPDSAVEELRSQLGLEDNGPVILALGRLVGKKGFHILVQAMAYVVDSHPRARCIIAGEGPQGESLRSLALRLKVAEHIRFPGVVPWNQVSIYMRLSDVCIVPSIHDAGNVDGLPTVVLEAMSAGRPVIASNVAGIPLIVSHGETGLLVPEQDPKQLALAICSLLDHPQLARRLGEAGQSRVKQELNWGSVVERFVAMYRAGGIGSNGETREGESGEDRLPANAEP